MVEQEAEAPAPAGADAFDAPPPVAPTVEPEQPKGKPAAPKGKPTIAKFGDEDDRDPAEIAEDNEVRRVAAERAGELAKLETRRADVLGELKQLGDPTARTAEANDERKSLTAELNQITAELNRKIHNAYQRTLLLERRQGVELQKIRELGIELEKLNLRAVELGGKAEVFVPCAVDKAGG